MSGEKSGSAEVSRKLLEQLAAEEVPDRSYYDYKLKDSAVGQQLLAASPESQRDFVLAVLERIDSRGKPGFTRPEWTMRSAALALLRRKLPFDHDQIITLLSWSARETSNYWRGAPQVIKTTEDYLQQNALTPAIKEKLGQLAAIIASEHSTAETRKWVLQLKELGGLVTRSIPLVAGEAWSDTAIAHIETSDNRKQSAWIDLLNLCAKASGSTPKAKWLKEAEPLIEEIEFPEFKRALLQWLALTDKPRTRRIESWPQWQPDPNQMLDPANADLLRGLVWLCAGREDKEIARALTALALSAYRKVPGIGPRCVRVGNACIWALGNMPGSEGIGQLAILKVRVKFGTAQKGIETALAVSAKRIGLPQDEIEEMSAPAYGLQEVGVRREKLGDFTAELEVIGTNVTQLCWVKPDGKKQTSVPQTIKDDYAEDLKEITQAAKDIKKILPAQRDRIENLYLSRKKWGLPIWLERYLNHPLVGTLARRLIWTFSDADKTASGVWFKGQIAGRDGRAIDWLSDTTQVELWHPMHEVADAILEWRDWLAEHEIQQPFKQAHREVYLLTDAERETRVYSNRFAAHIIKQHQFNALCGVRGWKNKLRLMVDDEFPPATRSMPEWGLRAEFWIEGAGDTYGTDTTDAGTYLYLSTDQVRFYAINAAQNLAHAGGGGYYLRRNDPNLSNEPVALEDIPPLVFSEIMRDVDMFVGVASVANDPNWSDGGPQGRYQEYWVGYSFGDLSETAKVRKQVLERLIPLLKIADRCRLKDRFLIVRGDVRTYKIHLGSSNILMEPNDQYLCIVPARGIVNDGLPGKLFLPFEGDNVLAVILSKALLLAKDQDIKDPTILQQIKR